MANLLVVEKSKPLSGRVKISGAKNAVLPILAASLLVEGTTVIKSVPDLKDVNVMGELITYLGGKIKREGDVMIIDNSNIKTTHAPYDIVSKIRASFVVLGPLLARFNNSRMSMPGGCSIGSRPIDLHLKGFKALNADINIEHGYVEAISSRLNGNKIYLDFPSVGATQNIMMAAVKAEGETIIENVAQEPEVVDLANFLNAIGAKVRGAGTNTIRIMGDPSAKFSEIEYTVIPDRIEVGTYMCASAITAGDIIIENVITDHIKPVIAKLQEAGCEIVECGDELRITGPKKIKPTDVKTMPHPGFPTDMQSPFMALVTLADGSSVVTETVFENRFMNVAELKRLGADIRIEGKSALITGVSELQGTSVTATDLRAGASLILAGLVADGTTTIKEPYHIQRGYVDIVEKFANLGASLKFI